MGVFCHWVAPRTLTGLDMAKQPLNRWSGQGCTKRESVRWAVVGKILGPSRQAGDRFLRCSGRSEMGTNSYFWDPEND
ncbi:hypothetical protein DSO57_1015632 [Entomophthora muscae]|uniref:Uncharacterized protein n=1 Tax=Entomophthora muscae TaxID=34485 RepID=A0ACC2U363_9FUNG|nr:hypothetical protein DSO57_1015632 [Entomophthora muscae]